MSKCCEIFKNSFQIIDYLSDGSSLYVRGDKRSPKMCLKSTERSRIITKGCSKIGGDKTSNKTENFPFHLTSPITAPIKLDENPVQLTSTESLLLLPELVETSFDSILTKVSFGRVVPLMRLFTISTIFHFNWAFRAPNRRYRPPRCPRCAITRMRRIIMLKM